MPSSATITSSDFFTFVAGTPARAAQVNSNFNIFRGHIIPVDPNTSASTTNTYDLGSSDYQFRNIYVQNAPIINGSPLGADLYIQSVHYGDNPPLDILDIDNLPRMAFQAGLDQDIRFSFQVISNYTPGNQIGLDIYGYHDVTGPTAAIFEAKTSLYVAATTQANTTTVTNIRTNTATVSLVTTAGQFFKNSTLTLTDTNGTINSVTVTSGNIISVNIKRTGTATGDSATGNVMITDIVAQFNV